MPELHRVEDMTGFTVKLQEGVEIFCSEGQNILEACLADGVPFPYNCRSGECAECCAELLEGTVNEAPGADPAMFSDADRAKGRILTCLCSPTSDITLGIELRDGPAAAKIQRLNAMVERVEQVSDSVVQVEFETPWEVDYRAGQYFEWGLPGIVPNRSYSAANRPGSDRIIFDLRLHPGGKVSEYVSASLHAGDACELIGPYGHFGFSENHHRSVVCVAGGTGLAPIKAMLEDIIATGTDRQIQLFYGARRASDLYDIDMLEQWSTKHSFFSYEIALSDEPEDSSWEGARCMVPELISKNMGDGFGLEAYLCGPPPMIDAAIPVLEQLGIEAEDIYTDRFSVASPKGI